MPQHLHCSSQLQLLWSSINATSSDAAAFMAPNLSSIYRAAFKLQWCHHSSSAAYIQHFSHNSIYSAPLTQQHFGLSIHDVDLTLHHFACAPLHLFCRSRAAVCRWTGTTWSTIANAEHNTCMWKQGGGGGGSIFPGGRGLMPQKGVLG